jgi:hypothetical protein
VKDIWTEEGLRDRWLEETAFKDIMEKKNKVNK